MDAYGKHSPLHVSCLSPLGVHSTQPHNPPNNLGALKKRRVLLCSFFVSSFHSIFNPFDPTPTPKTSRLSRMCWSLFSVEHSCHVQRLCWHFKGSQKACANRYTTDLIRTISSTKYTTANVSSNETNVVWYSERELAFWRRRRKRKSGSERRWAAARVDPTHLNYSTYDKPPP